MDITVKDNDSLEAILLHVSTDKKETIDLIISRLTKAEFLSEPTEEYGKSVENIIKQYGGFRLNPLAHIVFPHLSDNEEFVALFSGITFWGISEEFECEDCGCEMDSETFENHGHEWTDFECDVCVRKETNEPDWDNLMLKIH